MCPYGGTEHRDRAAHPHPSGAAAGGASSGGGNHQELPVLRANYILRALELPAGEYKILFEFAPELFRKGEFYSMAASSVLLILLLLAVIIRVVNRRES